MGFRLDAPHRRTKTQSGHGMLFCAMLTSIRCVHVYGINPSSSGRDSPAAAIIHFPLPTALVDHRGNSCGDMVMVTVIFFFFSLFLVFHACP